MSLHVTPIHTVFVPRMCPWDDQKPVTEFYRLVYRRDVQSGQVSELCFRRSVLRELDTLIHRWISLISRLARTSSTFAGLVSSLPFDFFVKIHWSSRGGGACPKSVCLCLSMMILNASTYDCRVLRPQLPNHPLLSTSGASAGRMTSAASAGRSPILAWTTTILFPHP